jgi:hypothetical protein
VLPVQLVRSVNEVNNHTHSVPDPVATLPAARYDCERN